MYCMQSKLKTCPKSESSINAGGCSFNSFLRRTVRFVGMCNFSFFFEGWGGGGSHCHSLIHSIEQGTVLVVEVAGTHFICSVGDKEP